MHSIKTESGGFSFYFFVEKFDSLRLKCQKKLEMRIELSWKILLEGIKKKKILGKNDLALQEFFPEADI